MKKQVSCVSLFCAVVGLLFISISTSADEIDLTKIKWGMTKQEVEKSIGRNLTFSRVIKKGTLYEIKDTYYQGIKSTILPVFRNKTLISFTISLESRISKKIEGDDIRFRKMNGFLISKYGPPISIGVPEDKNIGMSLLYRSKDGFIKHWWNSFVGVETYFHGITFYSVLGFEASSRAHPESYKFIPLVQEEKKIKPEETLDASTYDFRKARWGMSRDEVVKNETAKVIKTSADSNALAGFVSIGNSKAVLMYSFKNNSLERGAYSFMNKHKDKNSYIDDFKKIESALTKKYGKPKTQEIKWINERFKGREPAYGMAVATGELEYRTEWDTKRTSILHLLNGKDHKINHHLFYNDKTGLTKKAAKKENKIDDDL